MNDSAGTFFIELSSIFDPQGFDAAQKKFKETSSVSDGIYADLNKQSSNFSKNFLSSARLSFSGAQSQLSSFFDFTSSGFLDMEALAKQTFSNILASFISSLTEMSLKAAASGIFGSLGFGGGGTSGILSGLLGSRRGGGPIGATGPYYLHEGEFVLPPEVVSAIKQSRAPATSASSSSSGAQTAAAQSADSITVNAPITLNVSGALDGDVKKICEEISSAARRGVSWAVEQAKISYKIGKQKSGESSL